ncbi:MAG: AAA family ATPase [Proteobacteria bacterium]|nr:AAA family ATPase [Pseudomonadota bacterium]
MSVPAAQAETAAFLERLSGAAPIETHISLVFRGADTVWKLKKAVTLPFLDFAPIDARRRYAEREIALNQPAAPDLYRDVAAVWRDGTGALRLDPPDALPPGAEPQDWVLRMARVPEADFLDVRAAAGTLDPPLLTAIADAVAAYHAALPPVGDVDPVASMAAAVTGNTDSARSAGLPADQVGRWQAGMEAALEALAPWLRARAAAGLVRRAHGDLHLGNLCLWHGRPVPFDALEFDEALARIDLGYDLAFLLMDLDRRVDRAAANLVLNRYVARTGDAGLVRGLPPFLSMRAMVRGHVAARRAMPEEARSYLDAALAYLRPASPVLIGIGGLQGTGKSTLARALAPGLGAAPGALVLRSDETRKRLYGAAPEEALPQEAYASTVGRQVFAWLIDAARDAAAGGHAVIADATFLAPEDRTALAAAASAASVPFLGLWLHAPLPVLEARVSARQGDASDATVEVLRRAHAANPAPPADWTAIDATDGAQAAQAARALIAARQNWK